MKVHHLSLLIMLLFVTMSLQTTTIAQDDIEWEVVSLGDFSNLSRTRPVLIDFDVTFGLDGDYDVVIGQHTGNAGNLEHRENFGSTSTFDLDDPETAVFSLSYDHPAPAVVDFNGDGNLDLLVGEASGNVSLLMRTANNGNFLDMGFNMTNGIMVDSFAQPSAVDINNDGTFEIIVGSGQGDLVLFENQGNVTNPSWIRNDDVFTSSFGDFVSPFAIDPDGDNYPDFVIGTEDNRLGYLRNLGPDTESSAGFPQFEFIPFDNRGNPFTTLPFTSTKFLTPFLDDLDGDGFIDLLTGSEDGEITIYFNKAIDFQEVRFEGFTFGQALLVVIPVLLVAIAATIILTQRYSQKRGTPIYLLVMHSIGLAPYTFKFTEEIIDDVNLAGGAFSGIQAIINEITDSDLNALDAGENKILISRHNFPGSDSQVQVLLWSTEEDRSLRRLSEQFAEYIANTFEKSFEQGMFDDGFRLSLDGKIKELFSKYLKLSE